MMNGHWYSTSSVRRSSRWLGSPSPIMPTVVLVSSDSRIDRLMSARGQSTFHDPPWLSPPKPPLKMMRQNWNEPSTSAGVDSRTLPNPRAAAELGFDGRGGDECRQNQQTDDRPPPDEPHEASLPPFGRIRHARAPPSDRVVKLQTDCAAGTG